MKQGYWCERVTKAKDMYKTFPVAQVLNKTMTKEQYVTALDRHTILSNYTQWIVSKEI